MIKIDGLVQRQECYISVGNLFKEVHDLSYIVFYEAITSHLSRCYPISDQDKSVIANTNFKNMKWKIFLIETAVNKKKMHTYA